MGGILSSLNTSYTGLVGHQNMVDVTGHNIANANNAFYTRQRAVATAEGAITMYNYSVGQGVEISTIERIHDEFVFSRYKKASQEKQFTESEFATLRETSSYYPEIDGVGIYNDLQNYYDSWTDLAKKAGDPAQKLVLAQYTQTLVQNIRDTRSRLTNLQEKTNDEVSVVVDEINRLGSEIATINKQIKERENQHTNNPANDLRDKRDEIEMQLSKLVGASAFKSNTRASSITDSEIADYDNDYSLLVGGGYTLVDGANFHPLVVDNKYNPNGLYTVYYQGQDYKPVNITPNLRDGKLGALIDLSTPGASCGRLPGKLQTYIDDLDTFAQGLIEATNNIYAQSSQLKMSSDSLQIIKSDSLLKSDYNIKAGSFDIVMYDNSGNELGRRSVSIDEFTDMNSIVSQLNADLDDNQDGNALNDFNDNFTVTFEDGPRLFQINPKNPSDGISISLQDHGTNFAGSLGINRFFDGNNARTIDLAARYKDDPTLIRAYREAVDGNFVIANMMQQLQYDEVDFFNKDGSVVQSTISNQFKFISTRVATDTENIKTIDETKESVLASIQLEYSSISQVSIDEELTNLIRFQGGYSANAKVVSTIDQMINTLLGIKQ